jgi:acyl-CoA thioester hydrolase
MMIVQPRLEEFFVRTYDKLRYADTDGLGHVSDTVFFTFLETGRMKFLEHWLSCDKTAALVVARLEIDYITMVVWPGTVEIGTSVKKIGSNSFVLLQGVFQSSRLVASAETVMIYVDQGAHQPMPLPEEMHLELMSRSL